MVSAQPVLYIKSGCPWCREAENFFRAHQVGYDLKDVLIDGEAFARMKKLTNQTLTPSFAYKDFVVADFSTDEFLSALKGRPDIAGELGIPVA